MKIMESFIGKEVKVIFKDNGLDKIAKGLLEDIEGSFIRINGDLGVIILNVNEVNRITESKRSVLE